MIPKCYALVASIRRALDLIEFARTKRLPIDLEPVVSLARLEAEELAETLAELAEREGS